MKRVFSLRSWVIFPLLVSIYPPVNLLAYNIQYVYFVDALRSIIICLAIALVSLLILKSILREGNKAALAFGLLWGLFFTYGHAYNLLKPHHIFGLSFASHRLLILIWVALAGIGLVWILRLKRSLGGVIRALTQTGALILVIFPLREIGSYAINNAIARSAEVSQLSGAEELYLPPGKIPPDIYYIIVDSYLRQDVLQKHYGYDNSSFLNALEDMGFRVTRCSQSNYAWTELSLASSLNMDYLQTLASNHTTEDTRHAETRWLFQQSAVRRILKELGYKLVAFETGFYWTEIKDADIYITPASHPSGLNTFEVILVKTSVGLILFDAAPALPDSLNQALNNPDSIHRERLLFTLDKLSEVPASIPGPKFVFAHILAPHNPYVLDQDGNAVTYPSNMEPGMWEKGYFDELIYVNKRILQIINMILTNSPTPPIIILQGDHAIYWAAAPDRLKILNAYYLPGGDTSQLYDSISPVNSFRVVFNQYFSASYPLLEDRGYYSSSFERFQYELMPNTCP
jgi:hypothetical protein